VKDSFGIIRICRTKEYLLLVQMLETSLKLVPTDSIIRLLNPFSNLMHFLLPKRSIVVLETGTLSGKAKGEKII